MELMELMDFNALFLWRAAERLIALLIAAGSIYLGYQLFWSLKEFKQDGEGKLELPGGISIFVSRVGPGVFFAMFGTAIVAFTVTQPLSVQQGAATDTSAEVSNNQQTQVRYLGDKQNQQGFDQDFQDTERYLQSLNQIHPVLQQAVQSESATLATEQAETLLINLPGIRRTLLYNNWQSEWGSIENFQGWISSGDPQNPPENLRVPARLYLGGQP